MDLPQLSPRRPYLLRAFYEWLLDNQLTPHLVVDVTLPDVQVPMEYARDGQIVLNIAPRAVGNLELANDEVANLFGYLARWFAKKQILTENALLKTKLETLTAGQVAATDNAVDALREDYSEDELADIRGRKIGFIFQQFNLLPKLTAQENVELPLIYQGMSASKRHARSEEVLKRVGLLGQLRMHAIHRQGVLRQIVRADGEEID